MKNRAQALKLKIRDPFDCYDWLDDLHKEFDLAPIYFFLVAEERSKYDKNISTNQKAFYGLIEYYSGKYNIGIHPSWQSGDDLNQLKEELEWLETVADRKIVESRQHYIRFRLPETFRRLIDVGIRNDFSMGYGSINGFRASVCSSFYWYDLEKELKTDLLILPFCFMDANSLYEQKHSPQQAYHELVQYYEIIKKFNGLFVSVWHNSILGTDPAFRGWPEMFELFMKETVYWDAYYAGN